ncbi:MAG: radical SAM protein [Candidatus Hecatellales archaeon ex4484_218]|nr:MAG: radical SAM protein [Candidatus Hecatellales archaeon ex4484_218]
MRKTQKILDKAIQGLGLNLEEAKILFKAKNSFFEDLMEASRKLMVKKTGGVLKVYMKAFPPISITGYDCELNCIHCQKYYLKHMIPAETPEKLVKVCERLKKKGIKGVLLSGGSRKDGIVPLNLFLDAIKTVKKSFGLWIEAHTGMVNYKISKMLVEAGLDAALPDVVGDVETVRKVYGLNFRLEDYALMLDGMVKAGIKNISPHVCVGLHFGKIKGELEALNLISKFKPTVIVITVLIPTRGTPMEMVTPPKPEEVAKIIAIANLMFPKTPISLGCVRPGGVYRNILDKFAVKAGVSKIAVPSKAVFEEGEKLGLKMKIFQDYMCCCVDSN